LNYGWSTATATNAHGYVTPGILRLLGPPPARLVDLGCGNGFLSSRLEQLGYQVTAVEPSDDGVARAREAHPSLRVIQASVYDDLPALLGERFDAVVATEVIEHLLEPKRLVANAFRLLRPGGTFVLSTPYHGYLKNLAISLLDGWDRHWDVAWDGGHVKFFSPRSLRTMLEQAGFREVRFSNVGRAPWLWKSMIAVAIKQEEAPK